MIYIHLPLALCRQAASGSRRVPHPVFVQQLELRVWSLSIYVCFVLALFLELMKALESGHSAHP